MLFLYSRFCFIFFISHIIGIYFIFWFNKITLHTFYSSYLPIHFIVNQEYKNKFIFSEDIFYINYETKKYIVHEKIPILIINDVVLYDYGIGIYSKEIKKKCLEKNNNIICIESDLATDSYTQYHIEYLLYYIKLELSKKKGFFKVNIHKDFPAFLKFCYENNIIFEVKYLNLKSRER